MSGSHTPVKHMLLPACLGGDAQRIGALLREGVSWDDIAEEFGFSVSKVKNIERLSRRTDAYFNQVLGIDPAALEDPVYLGDKMFQKLFRVGFSSLGDFEGMKLHHLALVDSFGEGLLKIIDKHCREHGVDLISDFSKARRILMLKGNALNRFLAAMVDYPDDSELRDIFKVLSNHQGSLMHAFNTGVDSDVARDAFHRLAEYTDQHREYYTSVLAVSFVGSAKRPTAVLVRDKRMGNSYLPLEAGLRLP